MTEINKYNLVEWHDADIRFLSADAANYLGGLWLEEYVWHVVRNTKPDDVKIGVVGTWGGNKRAPARNEFDLLAVHNNRMLVVECKTSQFGEYEAKDADILTKLESLGRNAGGLFGRTLLVSARPLSEEARSRAASNHIAVIEAHRLGDLRSFVLDWMKS